MLIFVVKSFPDLDLDAACVCVKGWELIPMPCEVKKKKENLIVCVTIVRSS